MALHSTLSSQSTPSPFFWWHTVTIHFLMLVAVTCMSGQTSVSAKILALMEIFAPAKALPELFRKRFSSLGFHMGVSSQHKHAAFLLTLSWKRWLLGHQLAACVARLASHNDHVFGFSSFYDILPSWRAPRHLASFSERISMFVPRGSKSPNTVLMWHASWSRCLSFLCPASGTFKCW